MNEIQIFKNPEFGQIRTVVVNNEPMFCLADICRVLELQPSRVKDRLEDGVTSTHPIVDSMGRTQNATYVNEDGLYDTILDSRKAEAKAFRKWITSEVLPSIRKSGGYMATNGTETDEELMARALMIAQETMRRRDERIKELEQRNSEQKVLLTEQQPKVAFANAIIGSKGSILIGELAKLISQNGVKKIGQNRLFTWMRDNGYLGKQHSFYNVPLQKYIEEGLFEIKKGTKSGNDGVLIETTTTKVTGKGQAYFVNGFLDGTFEI